MKSNSSIAGGNAGMQTGTVLSKSECHFSEKMVGWNQSATTARYNTVGKILKRCSIIQQRHLHNCLHNSFICNSQNLQMT